MFSFAAPVTTEECRMCLQAEGRRLLAAEKKRATKLECELKKLTNMYETRSVDVKAFKSALAGRDEQIKAAGARAREQDAAHARACEDMQGQMDAITRACLACRVVRRRAPHAFTGAIEA